VIFYANKASRLNTKPKIAISACLLGQMVRYDGKEKKQPLIVDFFVNKKYVNKKYVQYKLSGTVEVVPFCPEVGIGLGVPRAKIQAVRQKDEQIRIVGVENHTWDVTEALKSYAENFLQHYQDIQYFIVKAKSPSCGYQSTPLFQALIPALIPAQAKQGAQAEPIALVSGLFVQTILELKPQLHIIDETCLSTEQSCLSLLQQILQQTE